MNRRRTLLNVLGAAALGGIRPAAAQTSGRIWRVGILPGGPMASRKFQWDVFFQRMRELGYAEGRNVQYEVRAPEKEGAPYDELATGLVRGKADVIVATGERAIAAAKKATGQIAIIMCPGSDPVRHGFVNSLGRPGTNVTGVNLQYEETSGKRLQLLGEMFPKISRVAFLWSSRQALLQVEASLEAAQKLGIKAQVFEVNTAEAMNGAFDEIVKGRAEALIVMTSPFMFGMRAEIATLALKHRLPAMFALPSAADAGLLMTYGPNDREYYRQAAGYVDRILKGAKPGDLPVEQPTKWELVINMKTAKAMGIVVPQTVLLQAERLIE